MRTIFGEEIQAPNSELTIVAYFDSVGCTSCRMKLPEWCKIMTKLDSIMGKNQVALLLVTGSDNLADVRHIVRRDDFSYPVVNDSAGIFAKLNSLSHDTRLQAFMLDSMHKVCLVGNPTQSKEMRNLYLTQFTNINSNSTASDEEYIEEYCFGAININEEVSHDFQLHNTYSDTLYVKDVILSCSCISANVSSNIIAPRDTFKVTVSFKDSILGDFIRSVTLKYQGPFKNHILEISGTIKKD